jgi:hypothetical protein
MGIFNALATASTRLTKLTAGPMTVIVETIGGPDIDVDRRANVERHHDLQRWFARHRGVVAGAVPASIAASRAWRAAPAAVSARSIGKTAVTAARLLRLPARGHAPSV